MKTLIVLAAWIVTIGATSADAGKHSKAAWEWTTEERLAARFDLVRNDERRSAYAENATKRGDRHPSVKPEHLVIEGGRNPELFLPFEIFDVLAGQIASGIDAATLEAYHPTDTFALEAPMFWRELDATVAPYLELLRRKAILEQRVASGDEQARNDLHALAPAACTARIEALERARASFGTTNFDRFLYLRIAPSMGSTSINAPHVRSTLQRLNAGCK
ncbi:MAG TPA: hypothetical protein VEK57_20995 [Thermoanaerobaculia bacterium]|nr:hypothetical protein [Thermoanaerobaculia bacterium]